MSTQVWIYVKQNTFILYFFIVNMQQHKNQIKLRLVLQIEASEVGMIKLKIN